MKFLKMLVKLTFLGLFIFLIVNGKMMIWLGIYGITLLLAILFGRIYCGYLCPMNTMMMPVEKITKKLNIQNGKKIDTKKYSKSPWFSLILSILVMIVSKKVLNRQLPILLIWLFVSIIVTIRYKASVFHNILCPFAPLQKLFAKNPKYSHHVEKNKCDSCKDCEGVCPSAAITVAENEKAEISKSYCFQCHQCQQICHAKTIPYGIN